MAVKKKEQLALMNTIKEIIKWGQLEVLWHNEQFTYQKIYSVKSNEISWRKLLSYTQ